MQIKLALLLMASIAMSPSAPAEPRKGKPPLDPNEKVCEKITIIGSRLATRKVCATRAEWADYRRQDRDAIEKAQRLGCLTQSKCGGS